MPNSKELQMDNYRLRKLAGMLTEADEAALQQQVRKMLYNVNHVATELARKVQNNPKSYQNIPDIEVACKLAINLNKRMLDARIDEYSWNKIPDEGKQNIKKVSDWYEKIKPQEYEAVRQDRNPKQEQAPNESWN